MAAIIAGCFAVIVAVIGFLGVIAPRFLEDSKPSSATSPSRPPSTPASLAEPPPRSPTSSETLEGVPTEDNANGNDSPTPTVSPDQAKQYLSDMDAARNSNGSLPEGSVNLAGTDYTNSIYTRIGGCSKERNITYALKGEWREFNATLGLTSDTDSEAVVYFRIYVDGKQVGGQYRATKFKVAVPKPVNVSGAIELKLNMIFAEGDMGLCSNAGYAAWGNAELSQ
ncbi:MULTISPECIES: NPCBM/NEW2 domain-containing protein [unclassified Streptomyces]|uniref:NPCBM/NEW2 domain-containing protein n=1 Tax=unclassified Streptomyces TaxID=2593676 RepID=UPI003826A297